MRLLAMLMTHLLTSDDIDPAIFQLFWIVAGSIGAAFLITIAWKVLRMALYLLSWVIIVLFGLVVFFHLALELF